MRLPLDEVRQDATVEPTAARQDADRSPTGQANDRQGTTVGTDRTRRDAAAIDLAPLAEMIERLTRRNEELSATAGMWQARAMHLEEQVRQLSATVERNDETGEAAESDEVLDQESVHQRDDLGSQGGVWSRLRRWWLT